jgi:hypothetical protein
MLMQSKFVYWYQNGMTCLNQTKTDNFHFPDMLTCLHANLHVEACHHGSPLNADLLPADTKMIWHV